MRWIILLVFCVPFFSCRQGETRDIYEFVRAADLGVVSFSLERAHTDNLRPGRELSIKAIALLENGEKLDISQEVGWRSLSPDILVSQGEGVFEALSVNELTKSTIEAEFAGLFASSEVWISIAPLTRLELGFAKKGVLGQCQMDTALAELEQCGVKRLCVLGEYEGELELREETLYAKINSSQTSVFEGTYIFNADVDLADGDVQDEIIAKLDSVYSDEFYFVHKSDSNEIMISTGKANLQMGAATSLEISGVSKLIEPYIDWSFESLSLAQPEASGIFSGLSFRADAEHEYVEDFLDYGVNIYATCSGKVSNVAQVLIESDVKQMKITDTLDANEIIIGSLEPTNLTLEAFDLNGEVMPIQEGDVSWLVCDLSAPECQEEDRQLYEGVTLGYVADVDEEERDLRIEAVFHGKKAVREDFILVLADE